MDWGLLLGSILSETQGLVKIKLVVRDSSYIFPEAQPAVP